MEIRNISKLSDEITEFADDSIYSIKQQDFQITWSCCKEDILISYLLIFTEEGIFSRLFETILTNVSIEYEVVAQIWIDYEGNSNENKNIGCIVYNRTNQVMLVKLEVKINDESVWKFSDTLFNCLNSQFSTDSMLISFCSVSIIKFRGCLDSDCMYYISTFDSSKLLTSYKKLKPLNTANILNGLCSAFSQYCCSRNLKCLIFAGIRRNMLDNQTFMSFNACFEFLSSLTGSTIMSGENFKFSDNFINDTECLYT